MNNQYDAMISYTVEAGDKEFANYVYEYLTEKGLDIWFSGVHLSSGTGKPIAQSIADAILNSKYAICIVSKKYLEPRWSSVELSTVLELMIHEEIKVIPILCNITGKEVRQRYPLLSAYMWISDNTKEAILNKVYSVMTETITKKRFKPENENVKPKKDKSEKKKKKYQKNTIFENNVKSRNININFGSTKTTNIGQQIINKGKVEQQVNIYMNDGTINF